MTTERRILSNYGQAIANQQWFKEQTFSYDGVLGVSTSMPYMPGNQRILGGFNALVDGWSSPADGTTVSFSISFIYVAITLDPVSGFQVQTSTTFDTQPVLVGYYQTPFVWPTTSPRQSFHQGDELLLALSGEFSGSPQSLNVHVYFN